MTTETEKDWPFPWSKVEGIYQSDGPKKPTRVEIDQVWYFVSPTGDDGIDTNRARQFVACLTCNEIVHHNTTGPSSRILHHHKKEHTAAPPKFVERVVSGISWEALIKLPTPTEKEKNRFFTDQRWRWCLEEGWCVLWWENDPDDVNKRLIAWAWAVDENGIRWTKEAEALGPLLFRDGDGIAKSRNPSPIDPPVLIKNISFLMKLNMGPSRIVHMRTLVAVADRLQIRTEADFNGVTVLACPGDDPESLDKNLEAALEQKEKFAMADRKQN